MIDYFLMKRDDLKFPFTWEKREPAIHLRVLFVPDYYDAHQKWSFPGWEASELFGNGAPVYIEYCSGNGDWILHKAREYPQINWVAVEKKFERVRKIWVKSQRLQLKNCIIVCGEALTFAKHYLPKESIDQIYVNFPDPWPKERHAKHRLVQKPFVDELSRTIKSGGKSIFVTDDSSYSLQIRQQMLQDIRWKSSFPEPFFQTEWPCYGQSYFDTLWREKGRLIYYMQFENR